MRQGDKALAEQVQRAPNADKLVVYVRDPNGPVGETCIAGEDAVELSRVTRLVYVRDKATGSFGQPVSYYPLSPSDPDYLRHSPEAL